MLFEKEVTIPAATLEEDATKSYLKVSNGVIHKIDIYFPAGCRRKARCQLYEGGHQFLPSTQGQYIAGEDGEITGKEFYEIKVAPRWITIRTWNLDVTDNHTIDVKIWMLPKWILLPQIMLIKAIETLSRMFG